MEIRIQQIDRQKKEGVLISCYEVNSQIKEIVNFIRTRQGTISGVLNETQYEIVLSDIFYFESVDDKTYIYTKDKAYVTKQRLYELEEELEKKSFLRVSKSGIINLMKITSIKPAMNGRFLAGLSNGEEVMISRKYVPEFKRRIKGGITR